jgi:O-antigen/teichoic acid export membrane protein
MTTATKKREILGHIGTYSVATQITQVLSLIVAILSRNLLGPLQIGIWSTLKLVLTYSSYTTLGTTAASGREIPYFLGKKDEEAASHVKDSVLSFGLAASVVTAVGVIVYALLQKSILPPALYWGLLFTAALLILQRINNVMISLMRAYKLFTLASHQMVISAVVNLVLVTSLSYFFKLYGFLTAMLLSFIFNIAYIAFRHNFHFSFRLDKSLKGLIAFGFPLMLIGVVSALLNSIDKILIIRMLGFQAMGLYSLAIMANEFLARIPNSIGVILIPHFQEKYGERDSVEDVRRYVDHAIYGLLCIMPILIGITWIVTPAFVRQFMPDYVEGIRAVKFLILGTLFFSIAMPYGDFLVTLKKHLFLFPVTFASIVVAFLLNIAVIQAGYGIVGVALTTTLTQFLYFLMVFSIAARFLNYSFQDVWTTLSRIFLHFGLMTLALLALDQFVSSHDSFIHVGLQLLLFILLHVPIMIALNRKFGVLDHLKERFTKNLKTRESTTDNG